MKIDEDDKIGGDNCFVGGASDEDISYVDSISRATIYTKPRQGIFLPTKI